MNDFKSGSIRKSVLGEIKGYYNGDEFDLSLINSDCRLKYDANIDKYMLFVPETCQIENININKNKNNFCSLDPGLREFLTGLSENKVIEIGSECKKKIKTYIIRKNKINKNENIPKQIKKKNEIMINRKILNVVDELHWKTIDYLTKNYENIFIGNMSSKKIISKTNKVKFSSTMKNVISSLKFFEFRKRLEYKCNATKTNYKCIDEMYTTIMCSICGNIKKDLGGSKTYNCNQCQTVIGRDINSCRCIYIKSI